MPYNIVLNSACNLNCDYCFAKEIIDQTKTELSLTNFKYVLDFFKKSNHTEISLLGGEPTLYSHFMDAVELLKETDFQFSLKTNALWNDKILNKIQTIPSSQVSFLFNINHPSSYSDKQWERILKNISFIKKSRMILGINIDKVEFEYDYILELARQYDIKYLRWSFAHPIFQLNKKRITQSFFPIDNYKHVSYKITNLVREANKLGIQTLGDHAVTYCMFSPEQIREIESSNGELNGRCEGTLDILPDLSVIYCLPMNSFFPKIYLSDFDTLDEIDLYFESRIKPFRILNYPFHECSDCEYEKKNICHGGCLAHRTFDEDKYKDLTTKWSIEFLSDNILYIPKVNKFKISGNSSKKKYEIFNEESKNSFKITEAIYAVLGLIDGKFIFKELIPQIETMWDMKIIDVESEITDLLEHCRTYDILRLK